MLPIPGGVELWAKCFFSPQEYIVVFTDLTRVWSEHRLHLEIPQLYKEFNTGMLFTSVEQTMDRLKQKLTLAHVSRLKQSVREDDDALVVELCYSVGHGVMQFHWSFECSFYDGPEYQQYLRKSLLQPMVLAATGMAEQYEQMHALALRQTVALDSLARRGHKPDRALRVLPPAPSPEEQLLADWTPPVPAAPTTSLAWALQRCGEAPDRLESFTPDFADDFGEQQQDPSSQQSLSPTRYSQHTQASVPVPASAASLSQSSMAPPSPVKASPIKVKKTAPEPKKKKPRYTSRKNAFV